LAENARLLILGPIVTGLVVLGCTFLVTPTYTATTKILPPQQQSGASSLLASQLGALAGIAGAAGINIKNPADTYVALLKSRTLADRLIERFRLKDLYDQKYLEDTRRQLEKLTTVSSGKDGLITIEVDDKDPKRAAAIANAYVEELFWLTGQLAITEAQQRRAFFGKQLEVARDNLKRAELALSEVGAGEGLIKSAPQAVVEGIARLKAQVTAQEIRLSTMRAYLAESSPELQLAQRELSSLRAQLTLAERDRPTKSGQTADYLNRYRDFKYYETLFELMAKQFEAARIDEAREGAVIQVVDQAVPPEKKSKPKRVFIAALSALATSFVLALLIFVREGLRNACKDPDSASKLARVMVRLRGMARL
jgi:uncharacterized protein involved in exopolysaccharide biosynthesis